MEAYQEWLNAHTMPVGPADRATMDQKLALVSFMEKHMELNQGEHSSGSGRKTTQQDWETVTELMDSIRGGAMKTWKQWQKFWTDQKQAVKDKCAKFNRFMNRGTGGGPPVAILDKLDSYEKRVLDCMGGLKRIVGYTQVIDPNMANPFAPVKENLPYLRYPAPSGKRFSYPPLPTTKTRPDPAFLQSLPPEIRAELMSQMASYLQMEEIMQQRRYSYPPSYSNQLHDDPDEPDPPSAKRSRLCTSGSPSFMDFHLENYEFDDIETLQVSSPPRGEYTFQTNPTIAPTSAVSQCFTASTSQSVGRKPLQSLNTENKKAKTAVRPASASATSTAISMPYCEQTTFQITPSLSTTPAVSQRLTMSASESAGQKPLESLATGNMKANTAVRPPSASATSAAISVPYGGQTTFQTTASLATTPVVSQRFTTSASQRAGQKPLQSLATGNMKAKTAVRPASASATSTAISMPYCEQTTFQITPSLATTPAVSQRLTMSASESAGQKPLQSLATGNMKAKTAVRPASASATSSAISMPYCEQTTFQTTPSSLATTPVVSQRFTTSASQRAGQKPLQSLATGNMKANTAVRPPSASATSAAISVPYGGQTTFQTTASLATTPVVSQRFTTSASQRAGQKPLQSLATGNMKANTAVRPPSASATSAAISVPYCGQTTFQTTASLATTPVVSQRFTTSASQSPGQKPLQSLATGNMKANTAVRPPSASATSAAISVPYGGQTTFQTTASLATTPVVSQCSTTSGSQSSGLGQMQTLYTMPLNGNGTNATPTGRVLVIKLVKPGQSFTTKK